MKVFSMACFVIVRQIEVIITYYQSILLRIEGVKFCGRNQSRKGFWQNTRLVFCIDKAIAPAWENPEIDTYSEVMKPCQLSRDLLRKLELNQVR